MIRKGPWVFQKIDRVAGLEIGAAEGDPVREVVVWVFSDSQLALANTQASYEDVMDDFPV